MLVLKYSGFSHMYDPEKKLKIVVDHHPVKPRIKAGPEINNRTHPDVIVIEKGETSDKKDRSDDTDSPQKASKPS